MSVLKGIGLSLALSLSCSVAVAQDYPTQPIMLVNPYAAGGPADVVARALARELEKQLGRAVVVENKPGGGASIGTGLVARAKPDGYTLLLGTSAAHVVTPLMQKTPYDGVSDFDFVAIVANQPNMVVVNPKVGVKTLAELIDKARSAPGKINYASAGPGSSPHLGGELFRQRANIDIVHIPYSGAAPAINDLVGGQVDMALLNLSASLPFIKDKRLIPLAYAAKKRSPLLPDVPTLEESGVKGAESASWYSLAAPKGTPPAVIEKLNKAVATINKDDRYKQLMDAQGVEVLTQSAADATAFVNKDREAMKVLAKSAGLVQQ
ncbi:Bug family tripartite tricarboxylate transporter substrate binding protein [Schauerella aestuarii]|uniref:Bug family tripartite tricarboxylate transporter substrate binding protein n=1 Tax=Schauerella aestuarii TaxID=2511204 RepID=UPI0013704A45|nr:tripartite tricarboxylate transporter substrate binding protein [Achromobacter aestuarii]MYZ43615.1 tripartite tricarboxylate transporter substrate binding protein [Achromobacter aestuarii]